jgi:plasmid stabilization system protein ParE
MPRVLVSASAYADTVGILNYLERKAGSTTADKYEALFMAVYDRLTEYPDSYAPRRKLGPHIRAAVVAPYIVIYEHRIGDTVNILRILHGHRRINPALLYG